MDLSPKLDDLIFPNQNLPQMVHSYIGKPIRGSQHTPLGKRLSCMSSHCPSWNHFETTWQNLPRTSSWTDFTASWLPVGPGDVCLSELSVCGCGNCEVLTCWMSFYEEKKTKKYIVGESRIICFLSERYWKETAVQNGSCDRDSVCRLSDLAAGIMTFCRASHRNLVVDLVVQQPIGSPESLLWKSLGSKFSKSHTILRTCAVFEGLPGWRSQVFNEYFLLLGTGFELVLQWISMISPETGCFPKLLVDHKASLKPYLLSSFESAWNQRCQQNHAVNVTSFRTFWRTSFLVVKTKTSHGTQKILPGMVSRKAKSHDTSTNPPLPYPSQRRLNKKVFLATRRALECLLQALISYRIAGFIGHWETGWLTGLT